MKWLPNKVNRIISQILYNLQDSSNRKIDILLNKQRNENKSGKRVIVVVVNEFVAKSMHNVSTRQTLSTEYH